MSASDQGAIDARLDPRDRLGTRRGQPRRKLNLDTSARQRGDASPVEVLNISETGLLLRTEAELALDEPLMVVLPNIGGRASRIVWSADGLFGCRFAEPISKADLSAASLKARALPPRNQTPPAAEAEESFGQRIKRLRTLAGYTMIALARTVGVSKPTLWKWESDHVRPRREKLAQIAAALGVSELELVYGRPGQLNAGKDQAQGSGDTLAEVVNESRRRIAAIAGVDESRIEITIDLGTAEPQ